MLDMQAPKMQPIESTTKLPACSCWLSALQSELWLGQLRSRIDRTNLESVSSSPKVID